MERNKVIYIAGPIKGVDHYWEAFEKAEDELIAHGFIPISPTRLPSGLTNAQYTRINLATIDAADAVYFLPGWENSSGAWVEMNYCTYTCKPAFTSLDFLVEVWGWKH